MSFNFNRLYQCYPIAPSLQWRHNEHDGVSNHQPHECLLSRLFQAQIKENIKAPRHWPLWGEFTGARWIPCTKGQWRGKCFHFMTSSWVHTNETSFKTYESTEKRYVHGLYSLWTHRLMSIGIPIMKLRWSSDRLKFMIRIPISLTWRIFLVNPGLALWPQTSTRKSLANFMGHSVRPYICVYLYMIGCPTHSPKRRNNKTINALYVPDISELVHCNTNNKMRLTHE